MLRTSLILTLTIMMTLLGCTTAPKVRVDFDRNNEISTSAYKTFAWLKPTKIFTTPDDVNPVIKVRIDNAIEQAFIARGYQLIDDAEQADFTISYTMGNRDKIKTDHFPVSYRVGFGVGGHFYNHLGFGVGNETHVNSYMEGKLAIDVYDVKTHQPVWHGWAVKRIKEKEQDNPSEAIQSVVDQVVALF